MDIQGKWVGWYTYNSKKINSVRSIERTFFTINIDTISGHNFSGVVEDDEQTFGLEGTGSITGKTEKTSIQFIKKMPFRTTLINGKRVVDKTKKHPNVYYNGAAISDNHFKGEWRFKLGFTFIGKLPAIILPIKGTWEMKREAED